MEELKISYLNSMINTKPQGYLCTHIDNHLKIVTESRFFLGEFLQQFSFKLLCLLSLFQNLTRLLQTYEEEGKTICNLQLIFFFF